MNNTESIWKVTTFSYGVTRAILVKCGISDNLMYDIIGAGIVMTEIISIVRIFDVEPGNIID